MGTQDVKIVVFALKTHADIFSKVMGDAGVVKMEFYSHCNYSVAGIGRFNPLEGPHSFIGEVGRIEEVEEERIEFICERGKVKGIIEAMRKVHPYEEVVFDIFPLLSEEEL